MVHATVYKEILSNGLVILVLPRHDIPKVCIQLFYNVGSKDEGSGLWNEAQGQWINEQGIAHFIEHMIFKGTSNLSESDINELTARLSGSCNAFTSYDYTGYLFDMPSQHWYEALPVMADCMKNCTFKQEHINSELKAVIQEIKMYNAVLVVTGDVAPTDVFKRAEEWFGNIAPLADYTKKKFIHERDISAQNVVIHRDVQQPIILYCWEIPGAREKKDYLLDLMSWFVGAGKGARLYNKLVTELGIATELQSFVYDLFDQGLFFIYVQPRSMTDVEVIRKLILEEIQDLCTEEVSDEELRRAQKKTEMDFLNLSEDSQKQGYLLGKSYLVTGDENYLLNYCSWPQESIKKDIQQLFKQYFAPSLMHSGQVLPLTEQDKAIWLEQQKKSDEEDTRILSSIIREEGVEDSTYANTIVVERPQQFAYPKAQKFVLSNGMTVLYYNKPDLGKIDLIMDLKAKHYYDPADRQGLSVLMVDLLQEGTTTYTAHTLATELESYGMELNTFPGQMAMTLLSPDLQKGLEILTDVLVNPTFKPDAIERIRAQLLSEVKMFWDSPKDFASQIVRKAIYKTYPYYFLNFCKAKLSIRTHFFVLHQEQFLLSTHHAFKCGFWVLLCEQHF